MSIWPIVTPQHIIAVFSDIFDSMAGALLSLARKKAQWKQD
jgi:hypothetical protein